MKTKNNNLLGSIHISNRLDFQRIAEGKNPIGGLYAGPRGELEKIWEVDDISELKNVVKCK